MTSARARANSSFTFNALSDVITKLCTSCFSVQGQELLSSRFRDAICFPETNVKNFKEKLRKQLTIVHSLLWNFSTSVVLRGRSDEALRGKGGGSLSVQPLLRTKIHLHLHERKQLTFNLSHLDLSHLQATSLSCSRPSRSTFFHFHAVFGKILAK